MPEQQPTKEHTFRPALHRDSKQFRRARPTPIDELGSTKNKQKVTFFTSLLYCHVLQFYRLVPRSVRAAVDVFVNARLLSQAVEEAKARAKAEFQKSNPWNSLARKPPQSVANRTKGAMSALDPRKRLTLQRAAAKAKAAAEKDARDASSRARAEAAAAAAAEADRAARAAGVSTRREVRAIKLTADLEATGASGRITGARGQRVHEQHASITDAAAAAQKRSGDPLSNLERKAVNSLDESLAGDNELDLPGDEINHSVGESPAWSGPEGLDSKEVATRHQAKRSQKQIIDEADMAIAAAAAAGGALRGNPTREGVLLTAR